MTSESQQPDVTGLPTGLVTGKGLRMPAEWDGILDILLDGHRVMSVDTSKHRASASGARELEWPSALRPFLRGSTLLNVQAHNEGTVLFSEEVRFDDTDERASVRDGKGFLLALDKWGNMVRTFENKDPEYGRALLTDLDKLLRVMNDEIGVPTFLAYGSLLGAVRGGAFIAHDTDADISYLSRWESPADILRESFDIERQLRRHGWGVHRLTGGFIQTWDPSRGSALHIDIFTSYIVGDWFAIDRWVRQPLSRDAILPLVQVELEGQSFPAPADADAVLAATYGPSWRVPDPSFKFSYPRSAIDRARGWLGHHHWIHGGRPSPLDETSGASDGSEPSTFAVWAAAMMGPDDSVVEVGCRDGADAIWLSGRVRDVVGFDHMTDSVRLANQRADAAAGEVRFERWSVYDLRRLVTVAAQVSRRSAHPVLYVRRVVEFLRPEGREHVWLMARTALRGGGKLVLEFGAPLDLASVEQAITRHGGTVDVHEEVRDPAGDPVGDPVGDPADAPVTGHRLVAHW